MQHSNSPKQQTNNQNSKDNSHHLWNIIFIVASPLYVAYLIANALGIFDLIKLLFN